MHERKPLPLQNLNPTLWRTCKMLAGSTRIRLLRQLYEHPGECVSALGKRIGIGESAASQELRRIQSRGLLQAERSGSFLLYHLAADPQVSSAAPILKAMQSALSSLPPESDEEMCTIASGLSHERRIRIVQSLQKAPQSLPDLQYALKISPHPFQKHLSTLKASGFAVTEGNRIQLSVPDHPLAKALFKLLQQGVSR